jgi:hypothetical protein
MRSVIAHSKEDVPVKHTNGAERCSPETGGSWSLWWLWALLIFLVSVYAFERGWAAACSEAPAGTCRAEMSARTISTYPHSPAATTDRFAVDSDGASTSGP